MAKKNPYEEIGDGKTPNKYVVSGSNNFLISEGDGMFDNSTEKLNYEGKTTLKPKTFKTYKEAKRYAQEQGAEIYEGAQPTKTSTNSITIDDRISGQIYEKTYLVVKDKDKSSSILSLPIFSSLRNVKFALRSLSYVSLKRDNKFLSSFRIKFPF